MVARSGLLVMHPQVVYSTGVRLKGGGIGNIAYHAIRSLYRHHMLARVLCSSAAAVEIPAAYLQQWGWISRALRRAALYDRYGVLDYIHSVLYDLWARKHIPPGEIFYGWNTFVLRSLSSAKAQGYITFVERASTHPLYQYRILKEEHATWGVPLRLHKWALSRSLQEIHSADFVVIPSEFVRDTFREQGFPEAKLVQVAFGVDSRLFYPAPNFSRDVFRVLFVGQVDLRKGIMYLLEAWKQLAWKDAELWVVGKIPTHMQELLTAYKHISNIKWMGYVRHLAATYRACDVFAFPSLEEGSALVTYEAMACGLPLVVTRNAGSLVRDGVEGFIVPIRDVGAICDRLEQLRASPRLRRHMGAAARRRVEKYTWDAYGDVLCRQIAERVTLT